MIQSLPEKKTLNGLFDAYCHVCWNPVYVLWVDDEPPIYDKCFLGDHHTALTCPDACGRAQLRSTLARLEREGLIDPPRWRREA